MTMGPNHQDGCDGKNWRHSGSGYNRVRVCACGAEDHAPQVDGLDFEFLAALADISLKDVEAGREAVREGRWISLDELRAELRGSATDEGER